MDCRTIWFLLLLCALSPAGRLVAQPSATPERSAAHDAEARAAFERGRAAYDGGDFETALSEFQRAHELSGRPELLFNIGQAADRLRRDDTALTAFERYLEERPEAENRREVENRVRALRATQPAREGESESITGVERTSLSSEPKLKRRAQPTREGFYAQAAVGVATLSDTADEAGDPTLSGAGVALDLGVGYGLIRGLALGGMLSGELLNKPKIEVSGVSGEELETATFFNAGPFLDWYPLAAENGLHFLGAVAFSSLELTDQRLSSASGTGQQSESARGGALIVGIGYEWAIQRDGALGALLRLTGAQLKQEDVKHQLGSVALLLSATWF